MILSVVLTIVGLVLVLGVVVFVHELGHYLACRISGVRVLNFSIGFRPVWRWTDRRGTEWRIGWVPFGGYCTPYGQDDMFDPEKYEKLSPAKKRGHYLSVSRWRRALIMAGGVIMNFTSAFLIFWALAFFAPKQVQLPVIGQVVQDTPAYNAGIRAGDRIMKINGDDVNNWGELLIAKEMAGQNESEVVALRSEMLVVARVAAADRWGLIADGAKTEIQRKNIWQSAVAGARTTWQNSKLILNVLKKIVSGERDARGALYSNQLGGFLAIAQMAGAALASGFAALFSFIALISVNLGVINLLPLPVLDGGYLLILGIEGITRKKIRGRAMDWIFVAGWLVIGFLLAYTLKNDIFRLFGWN